MQLKKTTPKLLRKLCRSKIALALPLTFMVLFVSTLGIIAFTYYFSVERINAQSQALKVSTAKENFRTLDEVILSTLWRPGSSGTLEISDCNGITRIQPHGNLLTISIDDNQSIRGLIFNTTVGKAVYQLPYSGSSETGLYLKGDSRTITDQSGASTSQLCIANGEENVEIQLRYRPTVTYSTAGLQDGKAVNNIRIYIVNLNMSDSIALRGVLPLKASAVNTHLTTVVYQTTQQPQNLKITSMLDGALGSVTVPVSSTDQGVIINIETVVCSVAIERWIR